MRIAIVGSGISGLVAAYRLHPRHEVTLFEADERIGGHTNTVTVDLDGERHHVDAGFIIFNDRTYPQFCRLMDELNVASRPTEMSFSVRDERSGFEYNGHSLNTLFAQRRNLLRPRFYRMLADVVRFNREARHLADDARAESTVGQFLAERRYSAEFTRWYLLPMGAAIWSCPIGTFASFPIRFVAEFYRNHGLLNVVDRPTWRVVEGGSHTYVRAMTHGFRDRIRLNSPVDRVQRFPDRVEVELRGGLRESFDHLIFACHSDQALRILGGDATSAEREVLGAFPYSRNVAVLHTDTSVLPRARRAWASWNYRIDGESAVEALRERDGPGVAPDAVDGALPIVTYNMNILQGIRSKRTFCVTLNGESRIDPDRVIRRFVYHHPVFTAQREAAQSRHAELTARNRTSYCGAYWRNGFHEDGVVSALAVVEAIESASPGPGESSSASTSTPLPTVAGAAR